MKIRKRVVAGLVTGIALVSYFIVKDKFLYNENTKLYRGIEENNIKLIDEALSEGCDINNIDYIKVGELKPIFIAMNNNNENNREVVKYLIEKGADANSCREDGTSILMAMAEDNNDDICNLLLDRGANIKYKDNKGYTALEHAVFGRENENRIMSTVELFLQRGSVVEPKTLEVALKGRSIYNDGDGNYALVKMIVENLAKNNYKSSLNPAVEAAVLGKSEKVRKLINSGKMNDKDKKSILFYTAAFGDVETIKLLQEKDLSLNICDNYGMSVLTIASRYGNLDVVKYLLDQGIDVNGGEGYVPPVVVAAMNNHYEVVKCLIESKARLKPINDSYNVLYEAANNGNIKMVDLILKSGYPLDDNYLFSTARKVIENNNTNILQYFLDNGYNLKVKMDGKSLLEYADNYYVAKVLVEGGLDIKDYNKSAKDLEMLEYLFEKGASPNRILESAIIYGNMDILNLTIKNNVDMNYIDETSLSKDSPLIMAAYSGSKSIMKKVIKNGADINYQNAEGATALMKVSNEGWTECAKLLVDAGADKNIKDNYDKKAVDYAKDSGIKKIVK